MTTGMIVLKVMGLLTGCFLFMLSGSAYGADNKECAITMAIGLLFIFIAAFAR